jgi:hypothetical protein
VPRLADLCIERKVRLLVGEITDRDEGKERWEEKEHVDRENGARVQECPRIPTIEASRSREELNVSKTRAGESVMRRIGATG